MKRRAQLTIMFATVGLATPAAAEDVSPAAYAKAVSYIDALYLRPEQIDARAMMLGAAFELSEEVHWLIVHERSSGVELSHGNGDALGLVEYTDLAQLPQAIASLESLVVDSGHPLGDVDVSLELLKGMTGALDRYTKTLAGDGLDRFDERLKGTLVGVGATVTSREGRIVVQALVPDGPAQKSGVQPGDLITRVDDASTVNMPTKEVVRRLKGDADTTVVVEVERQGATHHFTLVRAEIVVPNVSHDNLGDGVGYIKIDHFSQRTMENLQRSLAALREQSALDRGLVIDLRGNTGGSMREAARSADQFLTDGMLLRTAGRQGGRVKNLQPRMDASEAGDEPPVPVALLVDGRTASGSEILAGALLELDRAVLIGSPTYGKGAVQKIYHLDPAARLKLTVAEFILANDRRIADAALPPDVRLVPVTVDGYGVRFRDDLVLHEGAVPVLSIEGQRSADFAREMAKQVVLATEGTGRDELMAAVDRVAPVLRDQQVASLASAMAEQGIDWSIQDGDDGGKLQAEVRIDTRREPSRPDVVIVSAYVMNQGPTPLSRAVVTLSCDTFSAWDGLAIPVGAIAPGEEATGVAEVPLRPGIDQREDIAAATLVAHGRSFLEVGEEVLTAESGVLPQISVDMHLAGPPESPRAEVTITNHAKHGLTGVEVYFQHPGDVDVELVDRAARIPRIPGEAPYRVDLELQPGPNAPSAIPLRLVIEEERFRTLARWDVELPLDGRSVHMQPPAIDVDAPPSAPAGPFSVRVGIRDADGIDHVVAYVHGRKVAWSGESRSGQSLDVPVDLQPGANPIVVLAADSQGLVSRRTVIVRGEQPATVDAHYD